MNQKNEPAHDEAGTGAGSMPQTAVKDEKIKDVESQPATDLRDDMRKMINNPDYSDVVFVCNDGGRVHASRLFLVARSEVLLRMLTNGMAESQQAVITLHEVSSPNLLPVMEFLYTGSLMEYKPKGWRNAFEIIATAKFFLLKGLERVATEYLEIAMKSLRKKKGFHKGAKLIAIAVEFVTSVGEDTIKEIVGGLVWDMLHDCGDSELKHLEFLSPTVFQFCLAMELTKDVDAAAVESQGNAEFRRLRTIILWCGCLRFLAETRPESPSLLPEIKLLRHLLDKPLEDEGLMTSEQSTLYNTIRYPLAASIKAYLRYVNLREVPLLILVNVLEPMGIIPSSDMIHTLKFHALYPDGTRLKADRDKTWWTCMDDDLHKVCNARSGPEHKAPGNGVAIHKMVINHETRREHTHIYEWEIIIEEVCDDFIEIGLHRYEDGFSCSGCSLLGQPGGWALRMDPTGMFINRQGTSHRKSRCETRLSPFGFVKDDSQLVYGKHYAYKNSRVKISFTNGKRNGCTFTVDNKALGKAWGKFPDGTYYPAVSLGTGSTGSVSIRILKEDEEYKHPILA